jgi:hypothetical protein
MRKEAIEKATKRLESARRHLVEAECARSYREFESAWTPMLVALNNIYAALEQGAKDNTRSRPWFGRKKYERRCDPLLQYLHQARDADEHSLAPVTQLKHGSVGIGAVGSVYIKRLQIDSSEDGTRVELETGPGSTGKPIISVTPATARLVAVTSRGVTYDPPDLHQDKKLEDGSPIAVARLGLAYHELLIEEAKTFVC